MQQGWPGFRLGVHLFGIFFQNFKSFILFYLQFTGLLRQSSCTCSSRKVLRLFSSVKPQWDLLSAICIERKPIIAKELNHIEKDYDELCRTLEVEQSLLSDHEVRHFSDTYVCCAQSQSRLNYSYVSS